MARRVQARRVRVTATLDPETVKSLDHAAKAQGLLSRSQALEVALKHWLRERRRREIERETEAYYRSMTPAEKREDRAWARFASRAAAHIWDD